MKNLPLALSLAWAIFAAGQLGPVMNLPITLEIAFQAIGVLLSVGLVKLADVYTHRTKGI